MNISKFQVTVKQFLPDGGTRILLLTGRNAWALLELMDAGGKGCTPIENPAPRWSAYVYNLRNCGISIQTITEPHGGDFAGDHGRYVLRESLQIISILGNRKASRRNERAESEEA